MKRKRGGWLIFGRSKEDRLMAKIAISDGCWEWTGYRSTNGYGRVYWNGSAEYSHRVVYELLRGPLSDGLVIDHLCRNRGCQNPDHMEQVTPRQNIARGENHVAGYIAKGNVDWTVA